MRLGMWIGVVLAVAVAARADTIIVDNFNANPGDISLHVSAGSSETQFDDNSGSGIPGVAGGKRRITLSGTGTGTGIVEVNFLAAPGSFYLDSPVTYTGTTVLQYGFESDGSTFDMNLDLIGTGNQALFFANIENNDLGFDITVTVWDGDSDTDTKNVHVSGGGTSAIMWFSLFSSSIDFDDVAQLQFTMGGPAGEDFAIDWVGSTVPEPVTVSALLVGAAAMLRRRR